MQLKKMGQGNKIKVGGGRVPQEFDRDKFAGVIGSVFILKAGGGVTAELELLEVTELLERHGLRGFSILFRAPEDRKFFAGL